MLRTGIIKQVFAERTGISKTTGEPWCFTPILFEWKEEVGKVEPETHSLVIDIKGQKNRERINLAIVKQECVPVEFYIEGRTFKKQDGSDWTMNSARGYLGRDFDLTL